nr:hypothetical protein [Rhizobium azibense]
MALISQTRCEIGSSSVVCANASDKSLSAQRNLSGSIKQPKASRNARDPIHHVFEVLSQARDRRSDILRYAICFIGFTGVAKDRVVQHGPGLSNSRNHFAESFVDVFARLQDSFSDNLRRQFAGVRHLAELADINAQSSSDAFQKYRRVFSDRPEFFTT